MQRPSLFQRLQYFILFLIIAAAGLLVLFGQMENTAILASDAPVHQMRDVEQTVKSGYLATWYNHYWLGQRYSPIAPDLNWVILKLFSFPFTLNLMFSFNLFLAGAGFYLLLRRLELNGPARLFGALAFLFTSTTVTLVYPGHINKVMTYAWIPFSMAFFMTAMRDRRLWDYLLSGAFLGLALLGGEIQIPFYTGLWYACSLVFFLTDQGLKKRLSATDAMVHLVGLAVIAVAALIVGFTITAHALRYMGENTVAVEGEDAGQLWRFATQYFFPPEEVLSLFTTVQFFGAPNVYWGRDGSTFLGGNLTSPLRLSDDYMGLLPLGFAIVGGLMLWRLWQVRVFIMISVASLFISFGREGILFWLLYHLPTMKAQRNPHRWIYFVAIGVCVLAAYGMHWFWEKLVGTTESTAATPPAREKNSKNHPNAGAAGTSSQAFLFPPKWRWFLLTTGCLGIVLFMASGLFVNHPETIASWYFGPEAIASPQKPVLVERSALFLMSLFRTGFFLSISASSVWWMIYAKNREKNQRILVLTKAALIFLVLVSVSDLVMNAKRFVLFYPWRDRFENNQVANALKQDHDLFRVKATGAHDNPYINDLISNVLPYYNIAVVDLPAASRLPTDYANFFSYISNHYVRTDRYYDFFNVKYVLASMQMADPNTKFELIGQAENLFLYRRSDFMPRAWLVTSANVIENQEDALARTLSINFPFRSSVVLEEKPENLKITNPGKTDAVTMAKAVTPVAIEQYGSNFIQLKASASEPSMVVVGEKWDNDWKAMLDGKPVKIFRANYLMRAVEIPKGEHVVRMEYQPSIAPQKLSMAAMAVIFIGSLFIGFAYRFAKK